MREITQPLRDLNCVHESFFYRTKASFVAAAMHSSSSSLGRFGWFCSVQAAAKGKIFENIQMITSPFLQRSVVYWHDFLFVFFALQIYMLISTFSFFFGCRVSHSQEFTRVVRSYNTGPIKAWGNLATRRQQPHIKHRSRGWFCHDHQFM